MAQGKKKKKQQNKRKNKQTNKQPQSNKKTLSSINKSLLAGTQMFVLCAIWLISALALTPCEGTATGTIPKFSGNHS